MYFRRINKHACVIELMMRSEKWTRKGRSQSMNKWKVTVSTPFVFRSAIWCCMNSIIRLLPCSFQIIGHHILRLIKKLISQQISFHRCPTVFICLSSILIGSLNSVDLFFAIGNCISNDYMTKLINSNFDLQLAVCRFAIKHINDSIYINRYCTMRFDKCFRATNYDPRFAYLSVPVFVFALCQHSSYTFVSI